MPVSHRGFTRSKPKSAALMIAVSDNSSTLEIAVESADVDAEFHIQAFLQQIEVGTSRQIVMLNCGSSKMIAGLVWRHSGRKRLHGSFLVQFDVTDVDSGNLLPVPVDDVAFRSQHSESISGCRRKIA